MTFAGDFCFLGGGGWEPGEDCNVRRKPVGYQNEFSLGNPCTYEIFEDVNKPFINL